MDAIFDLEAARKILHAYVDEMCLLDRDRFILDPDKAIYWYDGRITRRQVKHVIEQRKEEGKSKESIKTLLDQALETIINRDFELPNTNKYHPGSIMRLKTFKKGGDGVVVVMDKEVNGLRDVITVF